MAKKKQKKIMVVDDDPHVVVFLKDLFTDAGYEVVIAANGAQAVDTARRTRPDLITLDIVMPESWGPRFRQALLKDPDLAGVPVVVISGLPASRQIIPNASAWLSKPADADALLTAVRQLIG